MKAREQKILKAMQNFPKNYEGLNMVEWLIRYKSWLTDFSVTNVAFFADAANLHRMRSVIYGLMVERNLINGVYTSRKFDVFGYLIVED
jgi:hypothetical protein